MCFVEFVHGIESKFEETINLQEKLFSIDSSNFESMQEYILSSKFILTHESLSVLLRCIDLTFYTRPLSFYLEIIKLILKQIQNFFSSYDYRI